MEGVEGAAPGGGHEQPPRGRARRPSRGRPGWEPWGTAGGAQEAGGAPAALGLGQREKKRDRVLALYHVEENRNAYNIVDCISLSLGAEYIGVHDLEGNKPLLQIW